MNQIQTVDTTPTFAVGDRVRYAIGSDVYPGTVVAVTKTTVTVREDKHEVDPEWTPDFIPGGFAGHVANNRSQKRIITEDPEGGLVKFTLKRAPKRIAEGYLRREGRVLAGRFTAFGSPWSTGVVLRHGWGAFYDYNF